MKKKLLIILFAVLPLGLFFAFLTPSKVSAQSSCTYAFEKHTLQQAIPDAPGYEATDEVLFIRETGGCSQGGDNPDAEVLFIYVKNTAFTFDIQGPGTQFIDFNGDISGPALYRQTDGATGTPVPTIGDRQTAIEYFEDEKNAPPDDAETPDTREVPEETEDEAEEENCENIGISAWILCPIVKTIEAGLSALDRAIQALLTVPGQYFEPHEDTGEEPLKEVWGTMRNLALILLVPIMLVMVISTALGFEFVSAYTVKKTLPRFLIAAIFITLSWPLMVFAVEFINVLSRGILGLMTTPLGGYQESTLSSHFEPGSMFSITWKGLAAVAALGVLAIMASFAFTVILVLITGFLLLTLREVIIISLVVVAPLAILSWIFPANTKLWSLWWGTFSKLLLLFPLIMLLIGAGRLVAGMVDGVYEDSMLRTPLILIAYVGPYALIPLTFKFAGGLFANLTGMINDKERGLFDRQKKFRQRKGAERWHDAKTGNFYKGNNKLAKGTSGLIGGATSLNKAGLRPKNWRANMATARGSKNFDAASKFMKESEAFAPIASDDDKLWAMYEGRNESEIKRSLMNRAPGRFSDPQVLNEAASEIMRAQKEVGFDVGRIAAVRAQASTGTGFSSAGELLDTINTAAGSDRSVAGRMLGEMRTAAVQSGRVDLGGGGFSDMAATMDRLRTGRAGGVAYNTDDATRDVMDSVIDGNGAQAVHGKVQSARRVGQAHARRVSNLLESMSNGTTMKIGGVDRVATDRDVKQALASVAGLHDAMAGTSPQNARAFADEVMGRGLAVSSLSPSATAALGPAFAAQGSGQSSLGPDGSITIRQAIDNLAGVDQQFSEMRRDYQTGAAAAAAAASAAPPPGATPPPGGGAPPGGGVGPPPSDKRLKRNIKHIATTDRNIKLYQFSYIWSNEVYVGVLAQELINTHPNAVYQANDGYYRVNYEMLNLKMLTLEEWEDSIDYISTAGTAGNGSQ